MEVGEQGEYIYLSLHCHHQNDSCIKMRAAMRAILMFINCEGQSHNKAVHKPQPFDEKGQPKRNRAEALLL